MILIIDDEQDLVECFVDLLQMADVPATGATSVAQAINICGNVKTSTIVIDHGVYKKDPQAVERLAAKCGVPVMMITGDNDITPETNHLAAKCVCVWHKPLDIAKFAEYLKTQQIAA